MGEQADLAAMMGFVRKHVTEHFRADGPGASPTVAVEFEDTAGAIESFGKHLRAASGALRQCGAGLLPGAAGTVELRRNFEVRSGEADPLGADIVQVGKDGGDGAGGLAGRLGEPGGRVEMPDEQLVDAVVDGEDFDSGTGERRVRRGSDGHGALLWRRVVLRET